jgi:hypothetical protein
MRLARPPLRPAATLRVTVGLRSGRTNRKTLTASSGSHFGSRVGQIKTSQVGQIRLTKREGHAVGGVSEHTYPHINYTTPSGAKATVRVESVK